MYKFIFFFHPKCKKKCKFSKICVFFVENGNLFGILWKVCSLCNKFCNDMKTILSITGSDSTGGSGVQADIWAMASLGTRAASAITSITVQSTLGIQSFFDLPASVVSGQMEAIFNDEEPSVVKIGMLRRPDVVEAVADVLRRYQPKHIIYDPVVRSANGDELMSPEVVEAVRQSLLPLCTLVIVRAEDKSLFKVAKNKLLVVNKLQGHGHGNLLSSAIAVMLGKGENVNAAVADAERWLEQLSPDQIEQNGRAASLYNRFLDSVEQYFRHYGDVAFYAEQLNVSSRYLAQVTKRFAAKSPKTLIDERIVNEIERQLMSTDKTVQEIAIMLGFSSQAHLSKFFRKMRNLTPTQYRKNVRG